MSAVPLPAAATASHGGALVLPQAASRCSEQASSRGGEDTDGECTGSSDEEAEGEEQELLPQNARTIKRAQPSSAG